MKENLKVYYFKLNTSELSLSNWIKPKVLTGSKYLRVPVIFQKSSLKF